VGSAPVPAAAANCQFVLGFKVIHDAIPAIVGDCKTDEYHGANGDALQQTAAWHGNGGLLVWRKCDNWTAFTDGASTWLNGPNGVQKRSNSERFPWERDCPSQQAPLAAAPQPQITYFWHPHLVQIAPNCDTTYMHGHVKTATGHLVNGIAVKTWNDWGNAEVITSGSAPAWESGSWLRIVNRDNNPQKWYAAIVDGFGNQASETAVMEFKADCNVGPQVVEIDFLPN
jgi:hypothetical protein